MHCVPKRRRPGAHAHGKRGPCETRKCGSSTCDLGASPGWAVALRSLMDRNWHERTSVRWPRKLLPRNRKQDPQILGLARGGDDVGVAVPVQVAGLDVLHGDLAVGEDCFPPLAS